MSSSNKAGFTLIELLVVIAIIGLLSAVAVVALNSARQKASQSKILADVAQISRAWFLWQADTGYKFQHEDLFADDSTGNPFYPCTDEPALSQTDLIVNVLNLPGWAGPYLAVTPKPPYGLEYLYDNDGDTGSSSYGGVYTMVMWCDPDRGARYWPMIPSLDKLLDNSDGSNNGRFRWDGSASYGHFDIGLDLYNQ